MESASKSPISYASITEGGMETLQKTIRQQSDTIDHLHGAAQKFRSRIGALEQQLLVKQAEIDSLRILSDENATIRSDNLKLRDKVRELEVTASHIAESKSLESENQAQLGVKLQAYQRHNNFLQGEIASREAKIRTLQEKIDVLAEEVHVKDRRVAILAEKLREKGVEPTLSGISEVHVSEEVFAQLKERVSSQAVMLEMQRDKLETAQEELSRRESLLKSLQRENAALKNSVSRLIAQINGTAVAASPSKDDASKLQAYHARRLQEYMNKAPSPIRSPGK